MDKVNQIIINILRTNCEFDCWWKSEHKEIAEKIR
jgi:hypothetical protein